MAQKKHRLATALTGSMLLFSTTAFAQSSVTISGAVDVGIEKTASGQATKMSSGRSTNSFYRINGSEDLGGGLKANFFLQHVFDATSGGSDGRAFNDGSTVGLSGDFGSINLGRSLNPIFLQGLAFTANETKGVSGYATLGDPIVDGGNTSLSSAGVNVNNQIVYSSPVISGFSGQVAYAPSGVSGLDNHSVVALQYVNGGFMAGVAQGTRPFSLVATTGPSLVPKTLTQFGVAYDFGVARVMLMAQKDRNFESQNAYALGVTAPMGQGKFWASYDVRQLDTGDAGHTLQLGYKYFMSKLTHLYAQMGTKDRSWDATNFVTDNSRSTGYGFGVNHQF